MAMASYSEIGNVPSISIFWNNLMSISINNSLKVWQNLALEFFEKGEL